MNVVDQRRTSGVLDLLRRRQPFDRLDPAHLAWVTERLVRRDYERDAVLIGPGAVPDRLFFLIEGTVVLEAMGATADKDKVLAELVEGECFPLEALHEDRPVFSTFRARSGAACLELTRDDFAELKAMSKVFADFCLYRSAAFLEQSRRVYRLHFSHRSDDQQRLNLPLSLLMQAHPLTATPAMPICAVLADMDAHVAELVLVVDQARRPLGTFTLSDLLHRVAVPEADTAGPIAAVMTPDPARLGLHALGYEAALVLAEGATRHVVVVDDDGALAGVVGERDLFDLQRVGLSHITHQIQSAASVDDLKDCRRDIHLLSHNMLVQGVSAEQLTQIISTLNDQLVTRVLELELKDVGLDGVRYAWITMGSEGRLEQTLTTDQDNGLIFASDTHDAATVRAKLLPICKRINDALDACGFPLCKGNIMASNPDWCLSLDEWTGKFASWMRVPDPQALLNATIFFDFRFVYGDETLADSLRAWLSAEAPRQTRFLEALAEMALQRPAPLGFFRDFVVDANATPPNTLDIKTNGVTLFVDAARVYALALGLSRSNTKQRLMLAGDFKKMPPSEVNAWVDALGFMQGLRLRHQHELDRHGEEMHNRLNPYELNNLDRRFFLEALRQAQKLQKRLAADYCGRTRM